jgi:hypothetical protein
LYIYVRNNAAHQRTLPATGERKAGKRKSAIAHNQLQKKRAESQPFGAPRNDGGRSFSTKERLPVYTEEAKKTAFFEENDAFFAPFR